MVAIAIHVVPDESFDDWVVRGDAATTSAITARGKKPNRSPGQSRKRAKPNSSFTSRTDERAARASRRGG
jgi:hypothetical protein